MNIESTEKFKEKLIALIEKVADEPVELIIVDDIEQWCVQRAGENIGNPAAKAIRDGKTKAAAILLRKEIDSNRINEIKGRMDVDGFWIETANLNTPEKFLVHLVLHELAHLLNNWGKDMENECDNWAFEKLGP